MPKRDAPYLTHKKGLLDYFNRYVCFNTENNVHNFALLTLNCYKFWEMAKIFTFYSAKTIALSININFNFIPTLKILYN